MLLTTRQNLCADIPAAVGAADGADAARQTAILVLKQDGGLRAGDVIQIVRIQSESCLNRAQATTRAGDYVPPTCRSASPTAIAHVIATLSDRISGRIGMRSRTSAASCTWSGTPADSRPNSRMSSRL
jgi:hypothetical protein